MKQYSKYKKHGWFYESNRHAMASKGIKTKFDPINFATDSVTYNNETYNEPNNTEESQEIMYEPVTVSNEQENNELEDLTNLQEEEDIEPTYEEETVGQKTDEELKEEEKQEDKNAGNMEDVHNIISAESKEKAEGPLYEPLQIENKEETYSEVVDREISEIENSMEPLLGQDWSSKIKSSFEDTWEDLKNKIADKEVSGISKHLGQIEGQKELINDKIDIIKDIRDNLKSTKYSGEKDLTHQMEQLEKLDKYIGQLRGDLKSIDMKTLSLKETLRTVLVQEKNKKLAPEQPGLLSAFNPFDMRLISKPQNTNNKQAAPKAPSIFPSWHEMWNPQELKSKR